MSESGTMQYMRRWLRVLSRASVNLQVTSFGFLSGFEAFMAGARDPIHLHLTLRPLVVHPRNLPFVHDIAIPSRYQETRYLLEMHLHEEDVQSYATKYIRATRKRKG